MNEPDFQLCGLSIWVISREMSDASNYLDRNWHQVRAAMKSAHSSVTTEGPILLTKDFERFRAELATMNESLTGKAVLWSHEPNLKLTLSINGLGHINGEVEITPDQMNELHRFDIGGLDQSGLPPIIAFLDAILDRFPVENWPES